MPLLTFSLRGYRQCSSLNKFILNVLILANMLICLSIGLPISNQNGNNNNGQMHPFQKNIFYQQIGDIIASTNFTNDPSLDLDNVESIFLSELSTLLLISPSRFLFYDMRQFRVIYESPITPKFATTPPTIGVTANPNKFEKSESPFDPPLRSLQIKAKSTRYFLSNSQLPLCHIIFQSQFDNSINYFSLSTEVVLAEEQHLRIASNQAGEILIYPVEGIPKEQYESTIIVETTPSSKLISPGLQIIGFHIVSHKPLFTCVLSNTQLEKTLKAVCSQKDSTPLTQISNSDQQKKTLYDLHFTAAPLSIHRIKETKYALVCNSTKAISLSLQDHSDASIIRFEIPPQFASQLGPLKACEFQSMYPINEQWSIALMFCKTHLTLMHIRLAGIQMQLPFSMPARQNNNNGNNNSNNNNNNNNALRKEANAVYQYLPISRRIVEFSSRKFVRILNLLDLHSSDSLPEFVHEHQLKLEMYLHQIFPTFFETGSQQDFRILPFIISKDNKRALQLFSELCEDFSGNSSSSSAYFAEEQACKQFGCEEANVLEKQNKTSFAQSNQAVQLQILSNNKEKKLKQMICLRNFSQTDVADIAKKIKEDQTSKPSFNIIVIVIKSLIFLACSFACLFAMIRYCPNSVCLLLKKRLDQTNSPDTSGGNTIIQQGKSHVQMQSSQQQQQQQPQTQHLNNNIKSAFQHQRLIEEVEGEELPNNISFVPNEMLSEQSYQKKGMSTVVAVTSHSLPPNIANRYGNNASNQSQYSNNNNNNNNSHNYEQAQFRNSFVIPMDETPTALPPPEDQFIPQKQQNYYSAISSNNIRNVAADLHRENDQLYHENNQNLVENSNEQNKNNNSKLAFLQMMQDNLGEDEKQSAQFILSESQIRKEQSSELRGSSAGIVVVESIAQQHDYENERAVVDHARQFESALQEEFNMHSIDQANYFQMAASLLKKAMFDQSNPQQQQQEQGEEISRDQKSIEFEKVFSNRCGQLPEDLQNKSEKQSECISERQCEQKVQKQRSRDDLESHSAVSVVAADTLSAANQAGDSLEIINKKQQKPHAEPSVVESATVVVKLGESLCTICYEFPDDHTLYRCGHRYCKQCAYHAFNSSKKICPYCLQEIVDVIRSYQQSE